jgi:hypothetical protein
MMTLRPVPSLGRVGGIASLCCGSKGTVASVEGVVGLVQQVDSSIRPYPQHLLPRTISAQGLAGPRPRQSGAATRVMAESGLPLSF